MGVTAVAVAMVLAVVPCATLLVAFRWWLDARPKPQPQSPASDVLERVVQLEAWRTRQEMGKLR